MDSKETKIFLKKAQINQNKADQDKLAEEAARLAGELEKMEESELRHGDYGFSSNRQAAVHVTLHGSGKETAMCDVGVLESLVSPLAHDPEVVIGNIFDDLKALSEDMEEFKIENGSRAAVMCKMDKDGDLRIQNDFPQLIFILPKHIDAFILNLRRLQATAKRRAK